MLPFKNNYHLIFLFLSFACMVSAKQVIVTNSLTNQTLVLETAVDYHLTSDVTPLSNTTINITSPDAWLFFDNVKPSVVLSNYKSALRINGSVLAPDVNARVARYVNGTVIIPHTPAIQPLEAFTQTNFAGSGTSYSINYYYTNTPGQYVPTTLNRPLGVEENSIRSFHLKRGYMATLANNSDGTGYSRVFIADTADLEFSELSVLLDKKVSFIRVFKWDYVSKKGWAGGDPSAAMSDALDCTWFYTWGATDASTSNLEFCPERWGLSWPGWETITAKTGAAHLLSFNEPDHAEQSNVSVDDAVADWPKHLQTGMRLGSPATTDFNWLYQFLDKCNAKNYRVDYIVVHGYWGGISPLEWYNKLYTAHMKTGKPVWIKEWNNGANWTNESWPNDPSTLTTANAAKQLSDLKGILNVMDTARFMERYSIYNWVEDARAMILNWDKTTQKGNLTPAGEFYKANKSLMAFDKRYEVVPGWKLIDVPVLSYNYSSEKNLIQLSWTDYNEEMISSFIVERSRDNANFEEVRRLEGSYQKYFNDSLLNAELTGPVYYRIKSVGYNDVQKLSNVVKYEFLKNETDKTVGELTVSTNTWMHCHFNNPCTVNPIVVFGTPSYMNKSPMTHRIKNLGAGSFDFKLDSWNYLSNPTYTKGDTISYMVFAPGTHDLGGVKAKAASVANVSTAWKTVIFDTPFDVIPVVFSSQTTNQFSSPASVRVRNVTALGFEVALQYEEAVTVGNALETVSYVAVTPGTGSWNGKILKVGRTNDLSVGNFFAYQSLSFGETYSNPAFFAAMQTVSDGITATLRYRKITPTYAEIFKDREISKTTATVSKETVGFMVVQLDAPTSLLHSVKKEVRVSGDPSHNKLFLSGLEPDTTIFVYSLIGKKLMSLKNTNEIDVSKLAPGIYILSIPGQGNTKFLKK